MKIKSRHYWSVLLGNIFEHYDTALFGLLAPFLAPDFFPSEETVISLILFYGIIPISMIFRPLGALFFGYLGDNIGRKEALSLSLFGMAVVACSMGLLPTYYQVGFLAPVMLALGKSLQSFLAAGGTMGGAIYLLENTPEEKKDCISSWFSASTVAGILLASTAVSMIASMGWMHQGWRVLYVSGGITALFGYFLRYGHTEEIVGDSLLPYQTIGSLLQSIWIQRNALCVLAIASGFSYSSYMIALVLMNGFIPLVSSVSHEQVLKMNTYLLFFDLIALPVFGYLSQFFSREKMMFLAGVTAVCSGIPLFMCIPFASYTVVVFIRIFLVIIGVWFSATFHSWSQTMVPPSNRFAMISFAYAVGTQVFGGPTASLSLWLYHRTGWVSSAAWYWVTLALLTSWLIWKQNASFKGLALTSSSQGNQGASWV